MPALEQLRIKGSRGRRSLIVVSEWLRLCACLLGSTCPVPLSIGIGRGVECL